MRLTYPIVLLFASAILCAVIPPVPTIAQSDDASYVYYFSREVNAFIVERADGTDRHCLAQGLARENASDIDGPGWSPSGQWLAWTENRFTKEYDHGNNPFVIHVDGTRRLSLLDDFNDAVLAWAPSEDDILLIAGTKNELVGEMDIIVYLLIVDMATETVLTTTEIQRPAREHYLSFDPEKTHYLSYGRIEADWLPDGEHATVYLEGVVEFNGNELAPHMVYVLDLAGGVATKNVPPLNFTDQPVSAAGWVASRTETGQLALENVLSDQRETITIDGEFSYTRMRWSPNGQYLLAERTDGGLYLVDTTDFTVTQIDETSKIGISDISTFYHWPVEQWSPGSNYIVFATQSANMPTIFYIYLYDIITQNTTQLPVYIDYGDPIIDLGSLYWTDADNLVFVMKHRESEAWEFTIYQVSTSTFHTIATPDNHHPFLTTAYLSPDEKYLTHFHETVGFQNVATGDETVFPPDSRSYLSNMVGEVAWDTTGDWVIVYEDAGVAGGGVVRWTGVFQPTNNLRRELGWCSGLGQQCIGWLPPQVDVNSLPLAPALNDMTEPELEIAGTHWNFYLDWSPDGTHLAAGADGRGDGTLTIWNLAESHAVESLTIEQDVNVKDHAVQLQWQPDYTVQLVHDDSRDIASEHYSPDGRFYVDTYYAAVGVYDANTHEQLHPLDIGNFNYTLSFTHDGRFLAVIHDEFPAYLLDTTTWETVLTFDTHATAAAFSPDDTLLALANGWNIQVWNLRPFYTSIGYEPAD